MLYNNQTHAQIHPDQKQTFTCPGGDLNWGPLTLAEHVCGNRSMAAIKTIKNIQHIIILVKWLFI